MSDTIQANQGTVTSIGDTDLVMCVVNGSYHPISFNNLLAAIKRSIQIGGKNLVRNSGISKTNSAYQISTYSWGNDRPKVGEKLLVTIRGQLGTGKTHFVVYNSPVGDGGFGAIWLSKESDGAYRGYLNINKDSASIGVYVAPDVAGIQSTISSIKIERGNMATDWTPAPEDIASGTWGGGNCKIYNYLQFRLKRGSERRAA